MRTIHKLLFFKWRWDHEKRYAEIKKNTTRKYTQEYVELIVNAPYLIFFFFLNTYLHKYVLQFIITIYI